MDIQRLRNLTTGKLHTKMGDVYEDIEFLVGESGIMTHMIPNAMKLLRPWLRKIVADERCWDGKYDPSHVGDIVVRSMTEDEREKFFERFTDMPSPFVGKEVICVRVGDSAPNEGA